MPRVRNILKSRSPGRRQLVQQMRQIVTVPQQILGLRSSFANHASIDLCLFLVHSNLVEHVLIRFIISGTKYEVRLLVVGIRLLDESLNSVAFAHSAQPHLQPADTMKHVHGEPVHHFVQVFVEISCLRLSKRLICIFVVPDDSTRFLFYVGPVGSFCVGIHEDESGSLPRGIVILLHLILPFSRLGQFVVKPMLGCQSNILKRREQTIKTFLSSATQDEDLVLGVRRQVTKQLRDIRRGNGLLEIARAATCRFQRAIVIQEEEPVLAQEIGPQDILVFEQFQGRCCHTSNATRFSDRRSRFLHCFHIGNKTLRPNVGRVVNDVLIVRNLPSLAVTVRSRVLHFEKRTRVPKRFVDHVLVEWIYALGGRKGPRASSGLAENHPSRS
mmetsp:Transcript_9560/g.28888  ORF Transcript_9560/g.28888 Transcript_9560/m.28888 type:complete len:386 (+) Transcript_9560:355-1512(+)